jgi:epsilon-lactone hydrolase
MTGSEPLVRIVEGQASWRSRALGALLRALREPLHPDADIAQLRQRYEALDARYFQPDRSVAREAIDCNGVKAEWVSVPESRPDRLLFYLHGGSFAFRFPNAHAAFAARLCRRLGARALIPDYRLAPEHPYPAAPDDCIAAYRWALAQGNGANGIVFLGDSAGGNLALVTLQRTLRAGQPLPACAVLLSPAVDCTLESRSIVDNKDLDPMLSLPDLLVLRHCYLPSATQYMDPDVSPLFADFRGLPPLFLQAGSSEILRDEAVRTAGRAHAAGVDVELELWPQTPHAFQMASFLPEAALATDQIARFIVARTGWEMAATVAGLEVQALVPHARTSAE